MSETQTPSFSSVPYVLRVLAVLQQDGRWQVLGLVLAVALGTVGCGAQANISSPELARVLWVQRGLAVLFNLMLLVLLVNLASGLL